MFQKPRFWQFEANCLVARDHYSSKFRSAFIPIQIGNSRKRKKQKKILYAYFGGYDNWSYRNNKDINN